MPQARGAGRHHSQRGPWRAWYSTARWKRLRLSTFVRDNYTCQMQGCGIVIVHPAERVCDHVKPHRGDETMFFNPSNLQTLCKSCHDRLKQREEQASLHQRGVWD